MPADWEPAPPSVQITGHPNAPAKIAINAMADRSPTATSPPTWPAMERRWRNTEEGARMPSDRCAELPAVIERYCHDGTAKLWPVRH